MSVRPICSVVENRTWGAYNGEPVVTLGEDETRRLDLEMSVGLR